MSSKGNCHRQSKKSNEKEFGLGLVFKVMTPELVPCSEKNFQCDLGQVVRGGIQLSANISVLNIPAL